MSQDLTIAIDGPAGAGKSTVAKRVAEKLGYTYIDTGAMYRAVTFVLLRAGVAIRDVNEQVLESVGTLTMELMPDPEQNGCSRVFFQGEDITDRLRSPEVNQWVSEVARIAAVREHLVEVQRRMARSGGVVMDGRDIGTVVLPNADVKVFLTASLEERARRRWIELRRDGHQVNREDVMESIGVRDRLDSRRAIAPLRQADGAVRIDTTRRPVDEIVDEILAICAKEVQECSID